MRLKSDLPQKICVACGRPFTWRKKWARDWEAVKFCSERCRRAGPSPPHDTSAAVAAGPRGAGKR